MRLLPDENVPGPTVRLLREAGYDVESMSELAPVFLTLRCSAGLKGRGRF